MGSELQPLDDPKLPAHVARPLTGKDYITYGASLMVFKYAVDMLASSLVFHHSWSAVDYFVPGVLNDFSAMTPADARFYLMMLGVALPFAYIGCVLTVRRLRTLSLPPYLVLLFYAPFVNMIFFTVLALVKSPAEEEEDRLKKIQLARKRLSDTPGWQPPAAQMPVPPAGRTADDGTRDASRKRISAPVTFGNRTIKTPAALAKPMQAANGMTVRMLDKIPSDTWVGLPASALLPIPVSVLAAIFSVSVLQMYGWGVFVAIPFAASISAVIIFSWKRPRTYIECLACALFCLVGMASVLLIIPFEGIICLLMASPIVVGVGLVGGSIGYLVQRNMPRNESVPALLGCLALLVPFLIAAEFLAPSQIPLYVNTSSVIIKAPPNVVWKYLIDFPQIPAPTELVFHTGIAYPIKARIDGRGPGAVRHCIFSTGEFVEPIKIWNEPRLLKFGVLAQAPPMKELALYKNLHPPHLDDYLVSRNGQFLLTALPDGSTLLDGTTWYQNYMGPSPYWRIWADAIIHRIHMRVLDHVKNLAEREVGGGKPITLQPLPGALKEKNL